ncbi:MAG: hypothetical protein HOP15_10115 [Planctomycetes bacterium]|nr:hypothetical protein [Planctomycetota bacterium]
MRSRQAPFALAAAAALLAAAAWWLLAGESEPRAHEFARANTVTLVVERKIPPPALCARVVLEPRRVLSWTLEGETP